MRTRCSRESHTRSAMGVAVAGIHVRGVGHRWISVSVVAHCVGGGDEEQRVDSSQGEGCDRGVFNMLLVRACDRPPTELRLTLVLCP